MTGVMDVMDPTGHTKVHWDSSIPAEVDAARDTFNALRAKGYSAFKMKKFGGQGKRLDCFDPDAEAMIMIPQLQGG